MMRRSVSRPGWLVCAAAVLVLAAGRCPAADYYVSSSSGGDGNPGTEASPWQTLAKVKATTLMPGDRVFLKRGDTWREALNVPSSGTSTQPITFGAYGEGSAKPVIRGSERVTGWTLHAGTVWKATLPTRAYMLTADGVYVKYRGTLNPSTATLNANEFSWNTGVLYVNLGGADPNGKAMEAGQRNHGVSGSGRDHVVVEGLRVENTNSSAFLAQNGSEWWTIRGCEVFFTNSATADGAGVHLNGAHDTRVLDTVFHRVLGDAVLIWKSRRVTVDGCHITEVNKGYDIGGDGIQASGSSTGRTDGFVITNNFVDLRGTDVVKGCIQTEFGDGGRIAGNTVLGGKYGIEMNSPGGVCERNVVGQAGSNGGLRVADNVDLDGMTFAYNLVYQASAAGLTITNDSGTASATRTNLKIYNNTFANCYSGLSAGSNISGEIKNNLVWNTSSTRNPQLSIGTVAAGGTVVSDHNLLGMERSSRVLVRYGGVDYYTLSAYQSATGQDANSLSADPLFVDPTEPARDYHLQSGSPAIDAGVGVGLTQDVEGAPVPQGGYNLGAYETVGSQVVAYEGFEYAAGDPLNGLGGGAGWGGAWSAPDPDCYVQGTGYTYAGLASAGGRARVRSTATRALLVRQAPPSGSLWLCGFLYSNNTARQAVLALTDGGATVLSVQHDPDNSVLLSGVSTGVLGGASPRLVLVRIDFAAGGNSAHLWIDPSLGSEPSVSAAALSVAYASHWGFDGVRLSHSSASYHDSYFDEVRIAKTFAAVTGN